MITLDTDHASHLLHPTGRAGAALAGRMSRSMDGDFRLSVISAEEMVRGWLSAIARHRRVRDQVGPYRDFGGFFRFITRWRLVEFDGAAADEFERLRSSGVRVATMDLKIASIALATGSLLLSANLSDFRLVPGLRVEDWTA
jgi:tRNA(fMet)-specific endonuclease VapC